MNNYEPTFATPCIVEVVFAVKVGKQFIIKLLHCNFSINVIQLILHSGRRQLQRGKFQNVSMESEQMMQHILKRVKIECVEVLWKFEKRLTM